MILAPGAPQLHPYPHAIDRKTIRTPNTHPVRSLGGAGALWERRRKWPLVADGDVADGVDVRITENVIAG